VATRSKRPIATEEIPRIFDDACIEELAQIGKLPASADMKRFAEGIREAAHIYATDVREPNENEVRAEVEKLYLAAERRLYDQVAILIEKLSARAFRLLKFAELTRTSFPSPGPRDESRRRGATSIQWISITLPSPETLRDHAQREEACATVVKLWRPYLRAPEPRRHFPKRESERTFVMWLRIAWLDATGEEATRTVDPRRPGPLARMVKKCLVLVGAGHADAVGLLNELNQIRRELSRRSALPPLL